MQYDEIRKEDRPVCSLSRKLTASEMRYPTVEKECLALVFLLSRLRRYVLDKELEIYTDSTAVRYLFTKSDPGSRLQRWIVAVQEFKFQIYHIAGKTNIVADVLSRYPPTALQPKDMESPDQCLMDSWLIEPLAEEDYE